MTAMPNRRFRFMLLTAALCALAALPGVAQEARPPAGTPAQKEQRPQEKKATGVVPEGVRLAAEMPAGAPPRPYVFPRAITRALPNGIRVFVVSDSEQPAIGIRLILPAAGAIHDPAGKPGVAAMTADLITQGTAKRSAQEIAQAIDFVGGRITTSADSDATYVTVVVVKKDLDLALDLLSDVVRNAAFQQEELDRRLQQALSGLRVQYADPEYLAGVLVRRVVYGAHPYGLPQEGTPDSLGAMGRDDLMKFRDTYYVADGALLAFAGDIVPETAFAAAQKFFGDWPPAAGGPSASAPAPAPRPGLRFLIVDKPDAAQTQIRVGRLGVPLNSPDNIALRVTNRIFGGGFNNRLNDELRVRKGLTYGAGSSFDSRRLAGHFVVSTFTRTETTVEATQIVLDLLQKMASGDVTPQELNFARDYLAGIFPIETEVADEIADRLLEVELFGLPADYNGTYQRKILGVTAEQVRAAAAKYLATGALDIVLAGNAGQFLDALKKAFPQAQFEEIPIDQVDLLSADLRRPKEAETVATPEAVERGRILLLAAAQAAGGAALTKIESFETSATGELTIPQGTFPIEGTFVALYPNKFRSDVKVPGATISQGFDGSVMWRGAQALPPQFNAEAERNLLLSGGLRVLQQALAGKVEAVFTGEEEVEGRKLLVADWNAPSGKIKLYFDPQSKHLAGARFRANSPEGASDILQLWSDFRDVEGVKYPFGLVSYRDGAKFIEQTVTAVKFNVSPDASLFVKPQ